MRSHTPSMSIRPRRVLATAATAIAALAAVAGSAALHADTADARAKKPDSQEKAKTCALGGVDYDAGSIVDVKVTTRDEDGNVVTEERTFVCGVDGNWHETKKGRVLRPGWHLVSGKSLEVRQVRAAGRRHRVKRAPSSVAKRRLHSRQARR